MYQIITDGSWDMGSERAARFGVEVVPYYVTMDGEHYLKEIKELDVRDFYQFMVDNPKTFPKTSLPTVQDYYDVFEKYAKQGIDIICFTLSAKFSGSYNSARNAGSMILENYPDIRVTVMDTNTGYPDAGFDDPGNPPLPAFRRRLRQTHQTCR